MADDFSSILAAARGQLGDAFRPRNELLEVGESALAAKGTGKPFAGFMQQADQAAQNKAMNVYNVMRGERSFNLQEQGLERQNKLLQMQIDRMGDDDDKWASSTILESAKLTNDPAKAYSAGMQAYVDAAKRGGKSRQDWTAAFTKAMSPFGSAQKLMPIPAGGIASINSQGQPTIVVPPAGGGSRWGGNSVQAQAARSLSDLGYSDEQISYLIMGKTIGNPTEGYKFAAPNALVGPPRGMEGYNTIDEAVAAASQRSNSLGQPARPATPGVTEVVPPPAIPAAQKQKIRVAEAETTKFKQTIQAFRDALYEGGGTGVNTLINNPRDPKAVRIITAYNNMLALLRGETLYNTGVLQQGELAWLRSIMLDPQGVRGALASKQAFEAQLGEMEKMADRGLAAVKGAASGTPSVPQGPALPPGFKIVN